MNFIGSDTDARPGTLADPGDPPREPIKVSHKKTWPPKAAANISCFCPLPTRPLDPLLDNTFQFVVLVCPVTQTQLGNSWIFFTFSESEHPSQLRLSTKGKYSPFLHSVPLYLMRKFSVADLGGERGDHPPPALEKIRKNVIKKMAAEGSCIDFMFLGPLLPGLWIRYWL